MRAMRAMRGTAGGVGGWFGLSLLSTVFLFGCGNGDGLAPHPPSRTIVREDVLAKADLQYYWKRQLSLDRGEVIVRMYCMDENLYFLTDQNHLYAMDAAVGNPKWNLPVTRTQDTVFSPTHISNMRLSEKVEALENFGQPFPSEVFETFVAVLINSMNRLLVIDRKRGKVFRDIPFAGYVATNRGVSDGTYFYVASDSRLYYSLKLESGVNVWWKEMGETIMAPMSFYNGRLYMGTVKGVFRCADVDNFGEKRWQLRFYGPVRSGFHVDARGVFLACEDRQIYSLDPGSGVKLWDPVSLKGAITGLMQVGELTIFQYAAGDGLYAINLANGKLRWKKPDGRRVLALMDGVVCLLDGRNNLQMVNEITGKSISSTPLGGFDFYAENLTAPAIYTARKDGKVFCIRPKRAGRLTAEMLMR